MRQQALSSSSSHLTDKLLRLLASKGFFYTLIVLLALQALWIALTARYPQAFDEQVHFGLIQLHARSLQPFFTQQPAGADSYGAVLRDPSYLYHYLFSFPYRLLRYLTDNQVVQIIVLRCLNIALLCSALPLYRRILQRVGMSPVMTNSVLLVFVITPVVPLLAAQINYDNLIVPLTGLLILLCLRVQQQREISVILLGAIFCLCLLGSIVKYAFLPLAAVALLFLVWQFKRRHLRLQTKWLNLKTLLMLGLCVLSLGLFSERYAINLVRYHTPTPECDQVLNEERCEAYSPWLRNHYLQQHVDRPGFAAIATYPASWLGRVIEESLFAIGSGFNNGIDVSANNFGLVDYWQGRSLIMPRIITFGALAIGAGAFILKFRSLLARRPLALSLCFVAAYVLALFLLNALDFLHIGAMTAVHGRYLVPILPLIIGALALASREVFKARSIIQHFSLHQQTVTVACLVAIFLIQGGGLITYVVRSEQRWFWPQSTLAQITNAKVQRVLKSVVIGSNSY